MHLWKQGAKIQISLLQQRWYKTNIFTKVSSLYFPRLRAVALEMSK